MKLKRLIPSVLSLALVFSLAACGGGDGGSANTPAQNETTPAQSETTPAQTEGDGSLQRVLDAGKLTIGAEGNWIPYVYNEDGTGELTGFEVEVQSARAPITPKSSALPWVPFPRASLRPAGLWA